MNAETWIIRLVALLCAAGSAGLLWVFGVFVVVPWRAGRLLALTGSELQVLGAALLFGLLTGWAAVHLLALGEKEKNPARYRLFRAFLLAALAAAAVSGMLWRH